MGPLYYAVHGANAVPRQTAQKGRQYRLTFENVAKNCVHFRLQLLPHHIESRTHYVVISRSARSLRTSAVAKIDKDNYSQRF